ncbi:MAG: ATP-binding protein [Thermoleophilia bacterium]
MDEAPQLVVMRGRRRVGKSFLLVNAFAGRRLLFFQADEQDTRGHLELFAREARELLPGTPPIAFADWDEALTFLGDQARVEPLIVVLDEFQWLWAAQPALDSMIQRRWDVWQREGVPLTLVLCGSSLIHMERLLGADRPLYGRAGYRPELAPLDFRWASEFAPTDADAEQRLRRYAVLGGTPQYQVWAGGGDLIDVIAERILTRGEPLYEEPLHLLREEQTIRTPGTYFDVLRAIAAGATRHNEIAQHAGGLDRGQTTKMLDRLASLGYIQSRAPLGPGGPIPNRGVFRIADPFFRFWFRFVFPNRSRLEAGRVGDVMDQVLAGLDTYMGLAFEDTCREWAARHSTDLPRFDELGSWWDRRGTTEIDVVATARNRYTLIGSCTWSERAGPEVLGLLRRDAEALGPAAHGAQLCIFARGFAPELIDRAHREGVRLVEAAELVGRPLRPPGPGRRRRS